MTASFAGEAEATAAGPGAGSRPPAFTLRDFLINAFFHIRVIFLAALVPLAAGVIAASFAKTEYTANSLLMVIVSREVTNAQNVTGSGPAVLSIEGLKQVESEVQILESADVIRTVIEEMGRDTLFPSGPLSSLRELFASPGGIMDRAIERFRRNLRAQVLDGSNVIEVSFTHPDRDIAIAATDKLVAAYMARRREIMENPTARILEAEVQRFQRDLASTDRAIEELKTRVGIINFDQDAVLAANQVDSVVQRRRQVAERKVAVAGQLAEAEKQLAALPATVFDFNQKSDALGNDDDNNALTRLLVERDRLSLQYSANGAMMREINRKIDTVRKQIESRNQRLYETSRDVRNPSVAYVNNMILSLRIEADALDRQEKELADQQAEAETRLSTLRAAETELTELDRRRETLSEGYREYLRRATAAKIEESAAAERQSNVRLVQDAGASVTSRSMRLPLLGAGLLGAVLFGAAAGAVASGLRSSFIRPTEAERALEVPLLGEYDNQSRGGLPAAPEREAGNLAALLLDTLVDGQPVRVVQFLGVEADRAEPDAALPGLAERVASEFTTQRGLRTLLVDLAAPSAPPDDPTARLKGGLQVRPTSTPLLWSLADAGASPLLQLRTPLAEAERLMQELRGEFEAVVFCARAGEAAALGHRLDALVDGNILFIRAEATRKPAILALRDAVVDAGGVPLGFVFVGRRYVLPDWIYRLS